MIPESVTLKLNRAREHLHLFDRNVGILLSSQGECLARHTDARGAEHIYTVRKPIELDPRFGVIIGDILHNARSALDSLVFPLVDSADLPEWKRGNIAFPICQTPDRFKERHARLLPGASSNLLRAIEECQPYGGRDRWLFRSLPWLHDLNRIDKHRTIHTVGTMVDGGKWNNLDWSTDPVISYGLMKPGAEVARFFLAVPNSEMDVEFDPMLAVAFGEPGPFAGAPVWDTLQPCIAAIEYGVIPRLRCFFD